MSAFHLIILTTAAPLVAFAVVIVLLRTRPAGAIAVTLAGGLASLAGAWILYRQGPQQVPLLFADPFPFGFLLDGLTLLMGLLVTLVSLLIQIYSVGYMAHDNSRGRYFALLAFFEWAMLAFVYAVSLMQSFVFWELVGLASYLLIGFWYTKPAAANAGRKAFVMTRIGDVGLFIGLILLFQSGGTLDIVQATSAEAVASLPSERLLLIALLLFSGVIGKSAQLPLHTWLPDAMEGPTPVSALLHSATMVAAGVFLVARCHPIFIADPIVAQVILSVALLTAFVAATAACVQMDIKRVLAYSSISQLSFMILGLAAGSLHAGMFHLITHALFKALLFLSAGAYIHHLGTNDLAGIGRAGGRRMRWTTAVFVVGAAALAGVPPLAGFFSKEGIFAAVALVQPTWFMAAVYLTGGLTAYYAARAVLLILRPASPPSDNAIPAEALRTGGEAPLPSEHGGEAPWVMRGPMVALAVMTLVAGFGSLSVAEDLQADALHPDTTGMATAIGVMLTGLLWAWIDFGRARASRVGLLCRNPRLEAFLREGWCFDRIYAGVVVRIVAGLTAALAWTESHLLDGVADTTAQGTIRGARIVRRAQSGHLQVYIGSAVLLLVLGCYLIETL